MNRGIKKVRKSIERRRRIRGNRIQQNRPSTTRKTMPLFPQDEEKHGYYPIYSEKPTGADKAGLEKVPTYLIKGVLSVFLFIGTAIVWQSQSDQFSQLKHWTSDALTEEFPFAKINVWYQETFGNPLILT